MGKQRSCSSVVHHEYGKGAVLVHGEVHMSDSAARFVPCGTVSHTLTVAPVSEMGSSERGVKFDTS